MKIEPYEGQLGYQYKMSPEVKSGYNSWREQRRRCHYKNYSGYKYYGAKGIKVLYSCREFITWWLENLKNFNGNGKPITSRKDHGKDYCFENIKIESLSDNSKECSIRTNLGNTGRVYSQKNGIKPIYILNKIDGSLFMKCPSIKRASEITGISSPAISALLNGYYSPSRTGDIRQKYTYRNRVPRKFDFKYAESI